MTNLTPSLEDYLETIYLLQQGTSEARVRDIATARDVKASSVSPALKRLADMGYLSYIQRESIRLTETGKIAARRIYARHVLLFQFFHDILGMPADKAREEACGLEHALSDEGMDRFVQFFESRSLVPDANADACPKQSCDCTCCPIHKTIPHTTLDKIADGHPVIVAQIRAKGAKRQAILDMGILPNIALTRTASTDNGICVNLNNHTLHLTNEQVHAIVVIARHDA